MLQALSSRLRLKVLAILCERVASPEELAWELNESLSHVSYHVGVLRECGLIVETQKIPRRGGAEHFYEAAAPTPILPGAWDRLPRSIRKEISAAILHHFLEDASAAMEAGVFEKPPGELNWTPLLLDAEGIEKLGELCRDFLESVLELQATASERLEQGNDNGKDVRSATVFLASFLSARRPEENKKASATKGR